MKLLVTWKCRISPRGEEAPSMGEATSVGENVVPEASLPIQMSSPFVRPSASLSEYTPTLRLALTARCSLTAIFESNFVKPENTIVMLGKQAARSLCLPDHWRRG